MLPSAERAGKSRGRRVGLWLYAHPGLQHRLLQLGELVRHVEAKPPLHVFLNVRGVDLARDVLACNFAQVHLQSNTLGYILGMRLWLRSGKYEDDGACLQRK